MSNIKPKLRNVRIVCLYECVCFVNTKNEKKKVIKKRSMTDLVEFYRFI